MRRALALVLLFGCDDGADAPPPCSAAPIELADQRLRAEGPRLLDAAGREVLLRGINTGGRSKDPPFMPFAFAESGRPDQAGAPPFVEAVETYADRLADWGLNVARVPFSWEGLEPTRGTYDATYLDRYVALVRALADRDVRVIVDFHQDVFHRQFCGDGFPDWALPEGELSTPPDCAFWFTGYLTNADVRRAFDRFWANEDGLRDAFADMWRHVSARLWPEPNVVGFEIINEPGWGTAETEVWAPEVLAPFYAEMAAVVREAAPEALVFVDGTGSEALRAETALPRPETTGVVFAPHYYAASVILNGSWSGEGDFVEPLGKWAAVGEAWGAPVLLGEFGVQPHVEQAPTYIRRHYAVLDALWMHAALWEYSSVGPEWNGEGLGVVAEDGSEYSTVDAFVRPFPAAVAGAAESFVFDPDTGEATLRYRASADGLTEIRAPQRLYPGGADITVEGVSGCFAQDPGVVRVRAEAEGAAIVRLRPR